MLGKDGETGFRTGTEDYHAYAAFLTCLYICKEYPSSTEIHGLRFNLSRSLPPEPHSRCRLLGSHTTMVWINTSILVRS